MEYDFKKTYQLQQWTPMIHFQHDQSGATLRATEVKPKLDRYLSTKYGSKVKAWTITDKSALDYKMSISCKGKKTGEPNGLYYGNMGRPFSEKVKTVMSEQTELTIVCFHADLMSAIDASIAEFFIVTNFGTMQDKGFGSFTVKGRPASSAEISLALRSAAGAEKCYSFANNGTEQAFNRIKLIYGMMKSGVNFRGYSRSLLFRFMHERYGIGNEKAFLKQKKMVPALGSSQRDRDEDNHYVRALLGVGDHIDFINSKENKRDKTTIKIENDAIQRLASPVFFKIIDNTVYFVGQRLQDNIYGKSFKFKVDKQGWDFKPATRETALTVPEKSVLGEDFIDRFLEYAVKELNRSEMGKFRDTANVHIKEV